MMFGDGGQYMRHSFEDALRQQIMDFEREYRDISEIVKKESSKRVISVLLEK